MKFTDGYWLLREGVTAAHPVEVLDVSVSDGTLEIHAPTQPIRHRGDLLKGPVVTISAHAPMPDVIGVTFTHFQGEEPRGPRFELHRGASSPSWNTTTSTRRSPRAPCPSGCPAPPRGTSTSSPTAAS